jgi:hypothetical protein
MIRPRVLASAMAALGLSALLVFTGGSPAMADTFLDHGTSVGTDEEGGQISDVTLVPFSLNGTDQIAIGVNLALAGERDWGIVSTLLNSANTVASRVGRLPRLEYRRIVRHSRRVLPQLLADS